MSLKQQFSDFFELPDEVILDVPLIMLAGRRSMYFENHKGIALYREDMIKIRLGSGFFVIEGGNLEITEINTDYIYISGKFSSFYYTDNGGPEDD